MAASNNDIGGEDNIACQCGDEAHQNLEEWHKSYIRSSADSALVLDDRFDSVGLETRIQNLLSKVPVQNGYCSACQKLLFQWPDIIEKVPEAPFSSPGVGGVYQQPHYESTMELEAGRRNGCRLCTLFVQCSIRRGHELELWHRYENRLSCLGKSSEILVSVRRYEEYFNLTLTWPGVQVWTWFPTDPLYCIKNYSEKVFAIGKETISPAIGTELEQLELAKKWLNICQVSHESCKNAAQKHQLPSRLIDVGCNPSRLVLTSNLISEPRYTTLSHCWGTQDFLKLEEACLEQFQLAIPENALTKTFQDAIFVTRYLGLQYLWIDALCIIQQSQPDWSSESALMGSVYGGSCINISASGARDGTQGCLELKPPGFVNTIHLDVSAHEKWSLAPSSFYNSVANSPLSRRAWALQERFLSPRTLHFTATDLFWECNLGDASATFPDGLPGFENRHIFHRDRGKSLSEIWHTLVRLYTHGQLRFARDKLVAISGLAERVQKETGDEYFVGLWKKDIEIQLLWCQQAKGRRLPRGSVWRAPSWSWASVDEGGFVYYVPREEGAVYEYYAHAVDAQVTPRRTSEPFGELTGATMKINCSLMLMGRLRTTEVEMFRNMKVHMHEVKVKGSEEIFRVSMDSNAYDGQDVFLLPILNTQHKETKRGKKVEIRGLILLATGNRGEYTRGGIFGVGDFDEKAIHVQERFLMLMDMVGKDTAEANCFDIVSDPTVSGEQYAIWVI